MPLLWAHAEYVKLRRSLRDGRVFDTPPQTVKRYLVEKRTSPHSIWRFNQKCRSIEAGKILRIELPAPALVHWSAGNWDRPHDLPTRATGLGVHVADLPTADLAPGTKVLFALRWQESGTWGGTDFYVSIGPF
jgi:glucoamylase